MRAPPTRTASRYPGKQRILPTEARSEAACNADSRADSARRAAEEILDLVAIGARELELVTALEREEVLAVHVRTQTPHQAQVDDGRAMDALEELWIQDLLELLHRAAQDVGIPTGVDAHVIPGGIYPPDRCHRHAHGLAALADGQHVGIATGDRTRALREHLIERELAATGDLGNDLQQPIALIGGAPGAYVFAHARERGGEARLIDWLEQIVDGVRLEGLDGVLVVGGDEHHHRHRFLRQMRQHLETRHAWHLDVEEHQVGLVLLDGGKCFAAVGTLRDDLEVGLVAQPDLDAASREHLVIDDERADLHAPTPPETRAAAARAAGASAFGAAVSSGNAISMRRPGWALSTAKRQFSPYSTARRSRVLRSPTPRRSPAGMPSRSPGPSSITESTSRPSRARPSMRTLPPSSRADTAYFSEFSSSGCSSRLGTSASSAPSSMAYSRCNRSPNRSRSVPRYRSSASIS